MSFNKIHKEDPLEIRPRFKVEVKDQTPEDLIDYLKEKGKADSTLRVIKTYATHLDIHMQRQEESFWSPVMQINIEKMEDDSLVKCLIGPQQTHWLMFVFIYGVLSVVGFFAGAYGLSLYMRHSEFNLWLLTFPLTIIIISGIYLMVKMAQKSKHEQIVHLVRFLYQHLEAFSFNRVEED